MRRLIASAVALSLVLVGLGAIGVAAKTSVVACGRGQDLQAAIDRAARGDTLIVRGTCQGLFRVTKNLTLAGAGSSATLRGIAQEIPDGGVSILRVGPRATVVVRGLTLTGNGHDNEDQGGAITNHGRLTLRRVLITGNFGHAVGGILNKSRMWVYDSVSARNGTYGGVNGIRNAGYMEVRRSFLRDGTGERGTHRNDGTLKLVRTTATNLGGGNNGHGFVNGGRLIIIGSDLRWISDQGSIIGNSGKLRISRSRLRGGTNGGSAISNWGEATLLDSTISGSVGETTYGGAITNDGILVVRRSTLQHNSVMWGGDGGAIYNTGIATIVRTTIRGNVADGDGGGIFNEGFLRLRESDIHANEALGTGGGIHNAGTVHRSRTSISGNIPDDCFGC